MQMSPESVQQQTEKRTRQANKDAYRKVAQGFGRRIADMTLPGIEVSDTADVSAGTNPGAWVQAWIWIPDALVGEPPTQEIGAIDGEDSSHR